MKNRGLMSLFVILIISAAAPAFAQKVCKHKKVNSETVPLKKTEKPKKSVVEPKTHPRTGFSSCGLYLAGSYMIGEFSPSDGNDHLTREGMGTGVTCNYGNHRSRFGFAAGLESYLGRFLLRHEEDNLKGSASYAEMGFKGWLKLLFDLYPVKLGLLLGLEQTHSSRFHVDSLQVDFGSGWFDVRDIAAEHLTSNGELDILEAGLEAKFPLYKNLSITFAVLWQRFHGSVKVKLDSEGKRFLEALYYDADKVNREFEYSTNFIYLTPGLKWCRKKLCASLGLDWGIFKEERYSWGLKLVVGRKI